MDILLIIAVIFIFLVTIIFLEKNNICDQGLCAIYDNSFFAITNYLVYFILGIILIVIALYYKKYYSDNIYSMLEPDDFEKSESDKSSESTDLLDNSF